MQSFEVLQSPNLQLLDVCERTKETEMAMAIEFQTTTQQMKYNAERKKLKESFDESLKLLERKLEARNAELCLKDGEIDILRSQVSAMVNREESLKSLEGKLQAKNAELSLKDEEIDFLRAKATAIANFRRRFENGTFMRVGELSSDEEISLGWEPRANSGGKVRETANDNLSDDPNSTESKKANPRKPKSKGAPTRRFRLPRVSTGGSEENVGSPRDDERPGDRDVPNRITSSSKRRRLDVGTNDTRSGYSTDSTEENEFTD
jgi:hypothetical protein